MPTSQITVSIDSAIKADLDRIFSSLGMTTQEAIQIFLRPSSAHGRTLGSSLATDDS